MTDETNTTGRIVAGRALRDYQLEAVEAMEQAGEGAHLVQMATGLGKTVTMAAYRCPGRVLILSHRDELVHQPAAYYDEPVGFEQAGEHEHGERVVSASVQSLSRPGRLQRFHAGDFDTVFTDEAHHALADSYRRIIDHLRPRKHIGLTATPRRGDGRGLKDVYGDIIFQRDLKWGITHHWLTDIDARRVNVAWDTSLIRRRQGDYERAALAQEVDNAVTNHQVAEAYRTLHTGQTLVFASSVRHAHALSELIDGSRVVDGTTPPGERRELIRDFTDRRIPCLINYGIFTEGTDLPLIETVIIARPTQNETLYAQMVGRGLRPAEGKTSLRLIDCVGVSDDSRLCTPPTLFGIDETTLPEKVRASTVDGSLLGLEARIEKALDTPYGWVLRSRSVDVLSSRLRIAWVRLPDGSRSVSGDGWNATLTAPDLVDNVTARVHFQGRDDITIDCDGLEEADDTVHQILLSDVESQTARNWWDRERVALWGDQPATGRQQAFVNNIAPPDERPLLDGITKYEAHCIIETHKRETSGRYGRCPVCGEPLRPSSNGHTIQCTTNRFSRIGRSWTRTAGCGTWFPSAIDGVRLDPDQISRLAAGEAVTIDDEDWILARRADGRYTYALVPRTAPGTTDNPASPDATPSEPPDAAGDGTRQGSD